MAANGRDRTVALLEQRIDSLERRSAQDLAELRAELAALVAPQPDPVARSEKAAPPPEPALTYETVRAAVEGTASPGGYGLQTGPRALAAAGGVVTLLGVVLIFGLAASRGWLGPVARCSIGLAVSLALVGAALRVQQRFAHDASANAAAGAGIGGLYATLFATIRLYHLAGTGLLWPAIVVIALLAAALALAWASELLASLGFVSAVVAPLVITGTLTGVEVGAAAIGVLVALAVGQARRWQLLAGLASVAGWGQALVYLAESDRDRYELGALLVVCFFALLLAGAFAFQRRRDQLAWLPSLLASATLPLGLLAVGHLVGSTGGGEGFGGQGQAGALAALALAYAVPAGVAWRRPHVHDLGELLATLALFAVALSTATLLSNGTLAVAWTLEALALLLAARRLARRRYLVAGLAFLTAAVVHLLAYETPPAHLFTALAHPAANAVGLVVVAVAVALAALVVRGWALLEIRLDQVLGAAAATLLLYAASLGVLGLAQAVTAAGVHTSFQRGETGVSGLWALVALVLIALGIRRRVTELRVGGLALLGIALAKLFLFDLSQLSSFARATSFLVVGVALLAGGFLVHRLTPRT